MKEACNLYLCDNNMWSWIQQGIRTFVTTLLFERAVQKLIPIYFWTFLECCTKIMLLLTCAQTRGGRGVQMIIQLLPICIVQSDCIQNWDRNFQNWLHACISWASICRGGQGSHWELPLATCLELNWFCSSRNLQLGIHPDFATLSRRYSSSSISVLEGILAVFLPDKFSVKSKICSLDSLMLPAKSWLYPSCYIFLFVGIICSGTHSGSLLLFYLGQLVVISYESSECLPWHMYTHIGHIVQSRLLVADVEGDFLAASLVHQTFVQFVLKWHFQCSYCSSL